MKMNSWQERKGRNGGARGDPCDALEAAQAGGPFHPRAHARPKCLPLLLPLCQGEDVLRGSPLHPLGRFPLLHFTLLLPLFFASFRVSSSSSCSTTTSSSPPFLLSSSSSSSFSLSVFHTPTPAPSSYPLRLPFPSPSLRIFFAIGRRVSVALWHSEVTYGGVSHENLCRCQCFLLHQH